MSSPRFFGVGNVWLGDAENETVRKLRQAGQLGVNAVRAGAGGSFLPESRTQDLLISAERMLFLCLTSEGGPFHVLFALDTDAPRDYTAEQIYAAGRAWGQWLADLYNGTATEGQEAELVVGFSVQNEFCRLVYDAGRAAYEEALAAGEPEEKARIAGEEAADAEAAEQVKVIANFCRGVRDTYPPGAYPHAWRVTGGLPYPYSGEPYDCLGHAAPYFYPDESGAPGGSGAFPVLNAVGVHWYGARDDFDIDPGPPIAVTPKRSFSTKVDVVLSTAGIPSSAAVFVQETTVDQDTFGWTPGDGEDERFEAAQLAMAAQLDMIFGYGRVAYVGAFSPWHPECLCEGLQRKWAIQIVYEGNLMPSQRCVDAGWREWIRTPLGAAVEAYVPPPSP